MAQRRFAVIGHPIGHTMSPFIHNRLFAIAGLKGDYRIIDVPPEELPVKISTLNELDGYNITIPNKQKIIPFLDKLDPKAELYGSVNTVRNGAVREGFTTDPDGFLEALRAEHIAFSGRVVIVGCGGVARTFLYEAVLAGCSVTMAIRQEDKDICVNLVKEVREKLGRGDMDICLLPELTGDIDLLINATPIGMFPKVDNVAVSDKVIDRCANVFDAVYNPLETVLVRKARANGAKASGGMAMLAWQAVVAHRIWDGTEYQEDDIRQLIEDSAVEMKKIF